MHKRLVLSFVLSVTGLVAAACGVSPGSSTATPTPGPTDTPTPIEATATPPVSTPTPTATGFKTMCITTEAYSSKPLRAAIGVDTVPTAFDKVNAGGCDFTKPITSLKIVLDGPGGTQTANIDLGKPTLHLNFPLPDGIVVPVVDTSLTPGKYTRTVTAYTAEGESTEMNGFQSVQLYDQLADAQTNLNAAKSKWEASGPGSYQYTIAWSCFCMTKSVVVEVNNGQVTNVTWADPSQTGAVDFPDRYGPMEQLFGDIQDAIDKNAARVTAQYDGTLGYPTSAFIDQSISMADEEYGWTISDFKAL